MVGEPDLNQLLHPEVCEALLREGRCAGAKGERALVLEKQATKAGEPRLLAWRAAQRVEAQLEELDDGLR